MASIRPVSRKDGGVTYQVLYRLDGRQSSLTLADPKSAAKFVALVEQVGPQRALEIHGLSTAALRQPKGITVAEWVRHYIDHMTGLEQSTLDGYNRYLRLDIAPTIGAIPLSELTEDDIADWVKRMESEPSSKTGRVVSPKTIKNRHGFLSGALIAAVNKKLIPANPAAGRRLPRMTGDPRHLTDDDAEDRRMLSRDEFDRLLAATTEHWRPLLKFMVASGMRWGEVTALKPADVNQAAGTVRVRRAWKYSSSGHTIGKPKTKRSRRTINVGADLLAELDYTHEWLFTNREERPVRYQGFRRRVWDRAVAKAKLDPPPTPHALRHTCGSWMLERGVPLTTVSRHLGHENISVTADIYTDVDRVGFAAAADAIYAAMQPITVE